MFFEIPLSLLIWCQCTLFLPSLRCPSVRSPVIRRFFFLLRCSYSSTSFAHPLFISFSVIHVYLGRLSNFPTNSNRVYYRVFNLKVDRILILVFYLLRFTTCYITQLTSIYSKCLKWCPFISMHLSTRFIIFLATFLGVL